MDLANLRQMQATHPYGLETEVLSSPYGTAMDAQQIPRPMGSSFSLQASSLNQTSTPARRGEHEPWPLRVLGEVRDLLLLLTPDGKVRYASPSCKSITGFDTTQLEHNHFSRFIHDDDKAVFARELRECIATARPLRCHFRLYQIDNSTCLMEAHGHPHLTALNSDRNQPQFCHGVFLVCRPYLSHSTQLLDSFLEHKLENIRLKEHIAQLKKDEEENVSAAQQAKIQQVPSSASNRPMPQTSNPFAPTQAGSSNPTSTQDTSIMPGEDNESTDTLGNIDDLDQALSRAATAAAQGEEDTSHIEGIELLTGLLYGDGERSQGISTGIRQARLVKYTGIPPSSEQDQFPAENEPRKRLKGEYRCADCGTSDSPEWRKGPEGPKTLCNACGLRWAKREKKRQDTGSL